MFCDGKEFDFCSKNEMFIYSVLLLTLTLHQMLSIVNMCLNQWGFIHNSIRIFFKLGELWLIFQDLSNVSGISSLSLVYGISELCLLNIMLSQVGDIIAEITQCLFISVLDNNTIYCSPSGSPHSVALYNVYKKVEVPHELSPLYIHLCTTGYLGMIDLNWTTIDQDIKHIQVYLSTLWWSVLWWSVVPVSLQQ